MKYLQDTMLEIVNYYFESLSDGRTVIENFNERKFLHCSNGEKVLVFEMGHPEMSHEYSVPRIVAYLNRLHNLARTTTNKIWLTS